MYIVVVNFYIFGVNFDLFYVVVIVFQILGEWYMIFCYFELFVGWIDSRCCKVVNCLRNSFSIVWVFLKFVCFVWEDD